MAAKYGFTEGEGVRLVLSFTGSSGTRYEAGWTGRILPLFSSLDECQKKDLYEINLQDSPTGENRGMLNVPSTYFERTSPTRMEGELRQGDRVRLLRDTQGDDELYKAGTVVTVVSTRTKPDLISHDVIVDFGETLTVPRESLEHAPGGQAEVAWRVEDGVDITFIDDSPI